jgi:flagellum-specific ATP synthase
MERRRINEALPVGVRMIDSLCTIARGQRVGIFGGSGVGKSTLLGMMARGTAADVTVMGLVGERGREVREFIEDDLGPEAMKHSVVAATSDQPPLVRLRGAFVATRIAEYFADRGLDVLLVVDSLTRLAMAQREVGLAAGEPPTARGYTPSVFSLLPRLLERAGPRPLGTITAVYTVLVEGDDMNEPIADAARSILDGHLVLSRRLADHGHFPALDPLGSLSRLAPRVTSPHYRANAGALRRAIAAAAEVRDLVEVGAYVPGTNRMADLGLAAADDINAFLQQDMFDNAPFDDTTRRLAQLAERLV